VEKDEKLAACICIASPSTMDYDVNIQEKTLVGQTVSHYRIGFDEGERNWTLEMRADCSRVGARSMRFAFHWHRKGEIRQCLG
jgi:hypothetical protein